MSPAERQIRELGPMTCCRKFKMRGSQMMASMEPFHQLRREKVMSQT